jgi:hypothetical protein
MGADSRSRSVVSASPSAPTSLAAKVRAYFSHSSTHSPLFLPLSVSLATSLLQGSKEEWSLVRRHPSERTFGVQIAGAKPATLVPAAEALARVCGDGGVDFVDLNCGCPIDLVVRTGSGSARALLAFPALRHGNTAS